MSLLHPFWLIGLLGLLIPLALHLWNKQQPKIIKIASTQYLESDKKAHSFAFDFQKILLFLLRCLLLGLLVLLIVQPFTSKQIKQTNELNNNKKKLVLIDSETLGVETANMLTAEFDTALYDFKEIAGDYWKKLSTVNYAQSNQLNPNDTIVVIGENHAQHFQSARPTLSYNIDWRLLPPSSKNTNSNSLIAFSNKKMTKQIEAEEQFLSIADYNSQEKDIEQNSFVVKDSLSVVVGEMRQKSLITSVLKVLGQHLPLQIKLFNETDIVENRPIDWLIASSNSAIKNNAENILFIKQETDKNLIELKSLTDKKWELTYDFNQLNNQGNKAVDLPYVFASLLTQNDSLQKYIDQIDKRTLATSQYETKYKQNSKILKMGMDLEKPKTEKRFYNIFLWLAALFIFVVERFWVLSSKTE